MKQIVLQEEKVKTVQETLTSTVTAIKFKELLLMTAFIAGAAGARSAMQIWPSVEPLMFFSVLGGWLFGRNKGLAIGMSSLIASNYLCMGGNGPWALPQMIAFGFAGWLGGLASQKFRWYEAVGIMFGATVVFEVIMNSYYGLFMGGNFLLAFVTGAPFSLIHIVSNVAFAFALPFAGRNIDKLGGFRDKKFFKLFMKKEKKEESL